MVNELPVYLSGGQCSKEEFVSRLNELDKTLNHETVEKFAGLELSEKRVACLDLSILYHTCQHLDVSYPIKLYLLFQKISILLNRIPAMIYEDNILFNPISEDPRLFTFGDTASSEKDFLLIHSHIEETLEKIIEKLMPLLKKSEFAGLKSEQLVKIYMEMEDEIKKVKSLFLEMRHLPIEHFKKFRDYYAAPVSSKHHGVSGRFSETMNTLRILIEGKEILQIIPNYFNELLENQEYYPSISRSRVFNLVYRNVCSQDSDEKYFASLRELVNHNPQTILRSLVSSLRETLDSIVRVHYGLTQKYILRDMKKNQLEDVHAS